MWSGSESIEITASPERVWAVVSDVSRHPELAGSGEVQAVRFQGAMAPGRSWEADEAIGDMKFSARSECVTFDPPKEFSWKSSPPPLVEGDADSVPDVTWWFRLEPAGAGTRPENGFRVIEPRVGAEALQQMYEATQRPQMILDGIRRTLDNVKRAAEGA